MLCHIFGTDVSLSMKYGQLKAKCKISHEHSRLAIFLYFYNAVIKITMTCFFEIINPMFSLKFIVILLVWKDFKSIVRSLKLDEHVIDTHSMTFLASIEFSNEKNINIEMKRGSVRIWKCYRYQAKWKIPYSVVVSFSSFNVGLWLSPNKHNNENQKMAVAQCGVEISLNAKTCRFVSPCPLDEESFFFFFFSHTHTSTHRKFVRSCLTNAFS